MTMTERNVLTAVLKELRRNCRMYYKPGSLEFSQTVVSLESRASSAANMVEALLFSEEEDHGG